MDPQPQITTLPQQEPVYQPPPPPKKSPGIVIGIFLLILGIVVGLMIDKTTLLSAIRIPFFTATPLASPEPTAKAGDPTTDWTIYRDTILGIEYKLPPKLGLLENSGREIRGDTGTQYCLIYVGSLSAIVKPVFAGSGACGGDIFTIGSVSKDYSAGREGGFADLTGYSKTNSLFYPRFIHTISTTPIASNLVTEITNDHDVTYLKIIGENTLQNYGGEQMSLPSPGTPGEGYMAALININSPKYYGFNIQMKITSPQDELIFDQILSSFKFTGQTSINTNQKVYTNTDFGFHFSYPINGNVQQLAKRDNFLLGGAIYKLLKSSNAQPQSSEVYVHVYDNNNLSLTDWITYNSTAQPFGSEPQKEFFAFVSLGQKSVNGLNGISFRNDVMGFTEHNIAVLKGKYVYVIGNIEVADDLSADYNNILSSFVFIN